MFLGAIFRTVKGGYDAVTIRKKIKDYNEELSKDLLGSFTPYEQFYAQERLLLAEYMIELSKLKAHKAHVDKLFELREGMNCKMKQIIEKAEKELEARNATKLDLARVVTGLRELSLAVDRDLNSFKNEIGTEQKKLQHNLKELDERVAQLADQLEQHGKETASLQKKAQTIATNLESLSKTITKRETGARQHQRLVWVFNLFVVLVIVFLIWRG